jgi:protein dithiol oxidoreductase (disulfide-forming)
VDDKKRKFFVLQALYTLLVIIASAVVTTFYIFQVVLAKPDIEVLRHVDNDKTAQVAFTSSTSIIEVFSYGCHYCEKAEPDLSAFEKTLPKNIKLIRLHIGQSDGLGRYAPLYATLTVMGVESKLHQAAFKAVLEDNLDLADVAVRNQWLTEKGVDIAQYEETEKSARVKSLLAMLQQVTDAYGVSATPAYIVGKNWVTLTDRDWPAMGEQLKSLLLTNKPLEK